MSEGAKKMDAGKLPVMRGVFLRFPRAMYEIARVSQAGTTKYGVPIEDMNYLNVPDGNGRYTDAVGRHLLDEVLRGPVNNESGGELPAPVPLWHDAQAAWDTLARLEIRLRDLERATGSFAPESARLNPDGTLTAVDGPTGAYDEPPENIPHRDRTCNDASRRDK